jgi:hypothetical protein
MRDEEADLEGLLLKGESGGGGLASERKRGARAWTGLVYATCCTSLHLGSRGVTEPHEPSLIRSLA